MSYYNSQPATTDVAMHDEKKSVSTQFISYIRKESLCGNFYDNENTKDEQ